MSVCLSICCNLPRVAVIPSIYTSALLRSRLPAEFVYRLRVLSNCAVARWSGLRILSAWDKFRQTYLLFHWLRTAHRTACYTCLVTVFYTVLLIIFHYFTAFVLSCTQDTLSFDFKAVQQCLKCNEFSDGATYYIFLIVWWGQWNNDCSNRPIVSCRLYGSQNCSQNCMSFRIVCVQLCRLESGLFSYCFNVKVSGHRRVDIGRVDSSFLDAWLKPVAPTQVVYGQTGRPNVYLRTTAFVHFVHHVTWRFRLLTSNSPFVGRTDGGQVHEWVTIVGWGNIDDIRPAACRTGGGCISWPLRRTTAVYSSS